uniref:Autophagy-related protein 2 n=1 Tax=Romanomermis culicivorax TaxID=13658 RepID=A0A915IIL2_ROMCU
MEDLQFVPDVSSAVSANSSNSLQLKTKNSTIKKHGKGKARRSYIRANNINEGHCENLAPFVSSVDTAGRSTNLDETLSDKKRNPCVKFLDIEEPDIVFVDNYLRFSEERNDFMNEQPADYPVPLLRYRIRDFTISCCIFGGRDFGNFSEQKVYSNLAAVNSTPKLRQKINDAKRCYFTKGGRNRDHTVAIELNLIRVNCLHELYPPDWPQVSRQAMAVQDIQIKDHLAVSNINKLLYCYSSAERPRPSYTPMLCLKILQYMPENDEIGESECSIKLSLLPLRIHLDQDSLLFVSDFVKDYSALSAAGQPLKRAGSSTHSLPIMGYPKLGSDSPQKLKIDCVRGTASYASLSGSFPMQNQSSNDATSYRTTDKEDHLPILRPTPAVKLTDEKKEACQENNEEDQFFELNDKLLSTSPPLTIGSPDSMNYDNQKSKNRRRTTSLSSLTGEAENRQISERQASNGVYFKNITFSPAVDLKLDYCGKHLQVEKQNVMEGILFGLGQLRSAQIKLKEVHNTLGTIYTCLFDGTERDAVDGTYFGWSLPLVVFRKIRLYFLTETQGIVDLFWMPVNQYRRDGHVVKGIQKGAHSFSVSTASAALELGQHLVGAVQSVAEFAFDVVNPSYPPKPNDILNQLLRPADFKDGVNMAYATFYRGFHDTAQALTLATQEEVARGNWAIKGVLRQATPTLIRPIVVTSRAATHILGGLRSQLRPDTLQEEQNKWKDD